MDVHIHIKKKHLYGFLVGLIVVLGAFLVTAFGGSSPSVMGHSAGELIVDSGSIVDGSITGTDVAPNTLGATQIDSVSLASECSSITGSAGLCDGSDADTTGISSCTVYTGTSAGTTCSASCASERLTGGGCRCAGGTAAIFTSYITSIGAGGFSGTWGCTCAAGGCEAIVECCS